MSGEGGTARRKLFLIFLIAFPVALDAAGETSTPAETKAKDAIEVSREAEAEDPLLVDAKSPRLRRLGASLTRDTTHSSRYRYM